ncbi:hypothetical protein DVH24_010912 [Malus domestica]|uniref:Knottins-like domain-containing protein n=1 Tax=Malus domestica TaxID=3750 RepID=A0A498JUH6_MALDO|nr:hypothetical protein DVH24_010912 [Malus domestica]
MERNFGLVLFFMIILITSREMVMHSEAKICSEPSKTFKGICIIQRNCMVRRHSEGYGYGKCSHVLRRCMFYKPCDLDQTTHEIS